MQMLFMDLDQAFICTTESRPEPLRDNRPEFRRIQGNQGVLPTCSPDSGEDETLEALHATLMLLAEEERYPEALVVIQKMMDLVTEELGISRDATKLNKSHVGHAVMKSMTLFRFHLLLIKTEAYIHCQIGNLDLAEMSLQKVLEFDGSNRLGARELLDALPRQRLNS